MLDQREQEKKDIEKFKLKIKEELKKEAKSEKIKELEKTLKDACDKEALKQKFYEDKFKALEKEIQDQKTKNEQKKIEEKRIIGNLEIVTIAKQTQRTLLALKTTINEHNGITLDETTKDYIKSLVELFSQIKT
jgi:hypothetical protein